MTLCHKDCFLVFLSFFHFISFGSMYKPFRFFHQVDQSTIRRMLHASGVSKKTLKKKHKIDKAMATFKVRLTVFPPMYSTFKRGGV